MPITPPPGTGPLFAAAAAAAEAARLAAVAAAEAAARLAQQQAAEQAASIAADQAARVAPRAMGTDRLDVRNERRAGATAAPIAHADSGATLEHVYGEFDRLGARFDPKPLPAPTGGGDGTLGHSLGGMLGGLFGNGGLAKPIDPALAAARQAIDNATIKAEDPHGSSPDRRDELLQRDQQGDQSTLDAAHAALAKIHELDPAAAHDYQQKVDRLEFQMKSKWAPEEATRQAVFKATAIFAPGDHTGDSGGKFTQIEKDAKDVNENDPLLDQAAGAEVTRNGVLEATRLKTLSPDQVKQYQAVASQLQGQPRAQLALQTLLFQNKFQNTPKATNGDDLLKGLSQLADPGHPVHDKIDRQQLLGQLVGECATPDAISQHAYGSCTVTSLQIMTALQNPAEYVRVVSGLATPDGKVKIANGDEIARLPGTEQAQDLKGKNKQGEATSTSDTRTISGRLWQASLMNYASQAGDGGHYDNTTDTVTTEHSHIFGLFTTEDQGKGQGNEQVNRAVEGITGKKSTDATQDWRHNKDGLVASIASATAAGQPVPVGVTWGDDRDQGHEILITKIDGDKVYFDNPWGAQQTMALGEFKDRVKDAHLIDR